MKDEIKAYAEYLLNLGVVKKPDMPKFDVSAYTESEYLSTIFEINKDYENIDEEYLTIKYLKHL